MKLPFPLWLDNLCKTVEWQFESIFIFLEISIETSPGSAANFDPPGSILNAYFRTSDSDVAELAGADD